jgi:hypothetical protein
MTRKHPTEHHIQFFFNDLWGLREEIVQEDGFSEEGRKGREKNTIGFENPFANAPF